MSRLVIWPNCVFSHLYSTTPLQGQQETIETTFKRVNLQWKFANLSVHKLIFNRNIWLLEKVYVPLQPYGRDNGYKINAYSANNTGIRQEI